MNKKLFGYGLLAGLIAVILAAMGNPPNMAICIACFIRDIAGSMKFHSAGVVQYFRPEILGLVLGGFFMALAKKEFRPSGGSSPGTRFFLGVAMMIGALVFLGCPTRMILRMAAGDLSAYIGLIGFVLGVFTGAQFLKKGFSLGRSYPIKKESGPVFPVVFALIFIMTLVTPAAFAWSEAGPGSLHAPVFVSLAAGLAFGAIAYQSRMCFAGGFRDIILMKNFDLATILLGIFIVMTGYNIATNNFAFVAFGPVAHAQNLWNILGLYVVGFAAVLLGGCPARQLVLAGQGSADSVVTVLGMFVGAAAAHNFGLAASGAAKATAEAEAVIGGPGPAGKIAVLVAIVYLFIVAITNIRKK
ncbi:MAG: YedE-related selenium metabolism membrane protein [Tissierellia bacterium]|nr:YedE-related selenium metabolism membrane protein [Tissierellia bacterium]